MNPRHFKDILLIQPLKANPSYAPDECVLQCRRDSTGHSSYVDRDVPNDVIIIILWKCFDFHVHCTAQMPYMRKACCTVLELLLVNIADPARACMG